MTARPIPEGYHTITPYLTVRGADKLVGFLTKALGAVAPHEPFKRPDGKIMHAALKIGDSHIMLAEEMEQMPAVPASLYVYVPDVDLTYKRAIAAGGKSTVEPTDQFYGDRAGCLKDPSGNTWWIATHKEDVSGAELAKRAEANFKKQAKEKAA